MQPSGLQKSLKFCVVTICVLCLVRQIWNVISMFNKAGGIFSGVGHLLRVLSTSSWLRAVFVDCLAGALFAALYIYLRRGPPLFGIPLSVLALLCILLGPFVPLLYICVFLLGESTLGTIALEVGADDADEEEKWLQPHVVSGFFLAYFIFAMVMWAITTSAMGVKNGISTMFRNVYARTLSEAYLQGAFVTSLLVVLLEGGNTWWAFTWFFVIVTLGNGGGCLYAFVTAWKAATVGWSFRKAFLTAGKSISVDGVTFMVPGQTTTYSSV